MSGPMGTLAILGLVILLIAVAIWIARNSLQNDESGLFRRFIFMAGAIGAFIAAGAVGYGISQLIVGSSARGSFALHSELDHPT
jgi:sugar phosphate permease